MNRRLWFGMTASALLAGTAFAAGPYSMNIGTGDGSLSLTKIYSDGNVDGDDATFDPAGAGAAGLTIWNNCFMVTNGTTGWFSDTGFAAHSSRIADGTIAPQTATTFTNTGQTYAGLSTLTSNLTCTLSQPASGQARITWAWTFNNSAASAQALKVIWFLDSDYYAAGSDFGDDVVAFVPANATIPGYTVQSTTGAIAEGNASSGSVNLLEGILMDSSVPISGYFGMRSGGPSFYWSNSSVYAGKGPEVVFQIDNTLKNTVEGDANTDHLTDAGGDCGAALQVDLNVPASGNTSVTFTATWGLNATIGGSSPVSDWNLYN